MSCDPVIIAFYPRVSPLTADVHLGANEFRVRINNLGTDPGRVDVMFFAHPLLTAADVTTTRQLAPSLSFSLVEPNTPQPGLVSLELQEGDAYVQAICVPIPSGTTSVASTRDYPFPVL